MAQAAHAPVRAGFGLGEHVDHPAQVVGALLETGEEAPRHHGATHEHPTERNPVERRRGTVEGSESLRDAAGDRQRRALRGQHVRPPLGVARPTRQPQGGPQLGQALVEQLVLDAEGAPDRVIFHCFSGDAAMATKCADRGFVMSFAGPVTFRNAVDLQAAARVAPGDLILVETDAPFLTPHPHRGKRNEPFALPYTVRALAELRGQDVVELCEQVNRTTEAMCGIRVN